MFTVFLYARLWRRAEVLTDVELVEIRYGGRLAAFLRGFRAVYVAVFVNAIIMGWVTGAMLRVLKYTLFSGTAAAGGSADWLLILAMLAIVGVYSTLSGLWGVVATDLIQFVMGMVGFVLLAVIAVAHVGGVDSLRERVAANFGGGEQAFGFLPDFTAADPWMPLNIFLIMLFVQWWASWYPGAEPGGGGFIVQRMASCKDERHAFPRHSVVPDRALLRPAVAVDHDLLLRPGPLPGPPHDGRSGRGLSHGDPGRGPGRRPGVSCSSPSSPRSCPPSARR